MYPKDPSNSGPFTCFLFFNLVHFLVPAPSICEGQFATPWSSILELGSVKAQRKISPPLQDLLRLTQRKTINPLDSKRNKTVGTGQTEDSHTKGWERAWASEASLHVTPVNERSQTHREFPSSDEFDSKPIIDFKTFACTKKCMKRIRKFNLVINTTIY